MDTITINGQDWVRLNDVCDILRTLVETPVYENTKKVIDEIAHLMFYDKIKAAKTDEEIMAAIELPGDFVIRKRLGCPTKNGKMSVFFAKFGDDTGFYAVDDPRKAKVFKYKSMADRVAKKLGKDWKSVCVGTEHGRIVKRVLDAIDSFDPDAGPEQFK